VHNALQCIMALDASTMENELTLRDKLAMSMEINTLPEIKDQDTLNFVAEELGFEWSDDPLKQIEFAFNYQAIMRYQYADAMIKARG